MNRFILCLSLALLPVPMMRAESSSISSQADSTTTPSATKAPTTATTHPHKAKKQEVRMKPFSQVAVGAGFSLMGVNLQAATNVSRRINLRATGNVFKFTENNISTNGFNIDAQLNMAAAGVSMDYYPFPTHGLRLSPGLLFYNQNTVSADVTVDGGQSFKLNKVEYYSSATNPVQGTARVGFNTQNPAFTLTTGWGNMISRKGAHISFPFEIGAAFVNAPTVDATLTKGEVCDATGTNCRNVATDAGLQSSLQSEIAKYKHDLDLLKVYPILFIGISYRFHVR